MYTFLINEDCNFQGLLNTRNVQKYNLVFVSIDSDVDNSLWATVYYERLFII